MRELPKTYNPREVEEPLYRWWEESGFFRAEIDWDKEPFVISMPPPNVTGELHMGHAMFVTLEDIMTRYHRMTGKVALWLPGTDHAGIATQLQVERDLKRLTRKDALGGGPRGLSRTALGVEGSLRWLHHQAAAPPRRLLRLEPRALHPGRGAERGGAGGLRAAVRQGTDLPRRLPGQLVAQPADRCERPGGGIQHRAWLPLLLQVSASRSRRSISPSPPRARKRSWATPPSRCTRKTSATRHFIGRTVIVPILGREIPVIADEYVEPRLWHGRAQDYPRPRPQRLRHWPAAQPAHPQHHEPRCHAQRGGRPLRRPEPLGGAGAPLGGHGGGGPRHQRPAPHAQRPALAARRRDRGAHDLDPMVRAHGSRWPRRRWRPCAAGASASCRSASRRSTSTGWKTSTTGASAASSGGATASPSGTSTATRRSGSPRTTRQKRWKRRASGTGPT